jgi:hypothetical protein
MHNIFNLRDIIFVFKDQKQNFFLIMVQYFVRITIHRNFKHLIMEPPLRIIMFYTTFNNISVISWWSILLMEESGGPGENHLPAASH